MSSFLNFLFGVFLVILFFLFVYSLSYVKAVDKKINSIPKDEIFLDMREKWYFQNRKTFVANLYFFYETILFISRWSFFFIFYSTYFWMIKKIINLERKQESVINYLKQ